MEFDGISVLKFKNGPTGFAEHQVKNKWSYYGTNGCCVLRPNDVKIVVISY